MGWRQSLKGYTRISYTTMADRLTQLQDTVNQQAEHFCNAIGIIQQTSYPSKFANFDRTGSQTPNPSQPQEDYAQLFAQLIARCAKDIDTLIESLPNEDSSIELQNSSLKRLEIENQETALDLEEVVQKGELLLEKIQSALENIAQAQLDMQITLKHNHLESLSLVNCIGIVRILRMTSSFRRCIYNAGLNVFLSLLLNNIKIDL
ncbi:blast:Mediator of RNA polymerase II transcription subunit 21 [Drosophila guanche]|uniref:Mediator of RNA polymerase II transcription subunit 21 n=1 Tax=Drosophila guanche TaxID=7266 RepID=A0A3B0KIK9_DROGU|nr:blast:Mediator of RNA polymerase II transcription subunit 21 [Drosophila guanche]